MKKFFILLLILMFLSLNLYSRGVRLRWDPNEEDGVGYRIFVRIAGQPYVYSNPAWEGTDTTCLIENLSDSHKYCFVARAFIGDLESIDSDEPCIDAVAPPYAPLDFSIISVVGTTVNLSWEPIVGTDISYKVFARRSIDSYDYTSPIYLGNQPNYTVNDLNSSYNYCFVVRAINSFGEGVSSNEICTNYDTKPSTPTGLQISVESYIATLTWNSVTGDEMNYKVFMRPTDGSYDWGKSACQVGSTGCSVSGLKRSKNSCFVVKALNPGGESSTSTEVCSSYKLAPVPPKQIKTGTR